MTKQRLADRAQESGDFIQTEDGFYVYWPRGLGGYLSAEVLRALADKLDEMNAEWREVVEREIGGEISDL